MRATKGTVIIFALALMAACSSGGGAPCCASGSLDTGFGTDGIVSTPVATPGSSYARAVAVQADGKIVAAGGTGSGEFVVIRYGTDGTPDPDFGSNGIVSMLVGTFTGDAADVLVQPDQMIVAAGSVWTGTNNELALIRYESGGTPDASFGANGIVTTPVGTANVRATAVAVRTDGRIIAAGYIDGGNYNGMIARYLQNGALDTSFGSGGMVTFDVGPWDIIEAVAVRSDNKILLAGTSNYNNFLLARYTAEGTPDATFGTNGVVLTDIAGSGQDFATDMILQPDGKIVLAGGTATTPAAYDYSLVRYNQNGSIDTTFGTNGIVVVPILCNNDFGAEVALQADGKIVVTAPGSDTGDSPHDTIVMRYLPNGTLDTGFGTNGRVVASMGALSDIPYEMTIQADGRIVIAGIDAWPDGIVSLVRIYP